MQRFNIPFSYYFIVTSMLYTIYEVKGKKYIEFDRIIKEVIME